MQTVHIWEVNATLDAWGNVDAPFDFSCLLKEKIVTFEKSYSEAQRVGNKRLSDILEMEYRHCNVEDIDVPSNLQVTYIGEATSVLLD
ncbi:hypothetical protein [Bacillus paranthracis]|uniref:hypothetical protein n=1 Tax=Bacillus paranthracis TaxID=2026186 RepID=UPI0020B7F9F1|nr:hypothetical protein MON10_08295 [Bacillus paranthracis]